MANFIPPVTNVNKHDIRNKQYTTYLAKKGVTLLWAISTVRYAVMWQSGIPMQFGKPSGIIPIPKPLDNELVKLNFVVGVL